MRVPEDAKGPITLTAKLNYRKFAHYYTQFVYAGQPKPGQPPGLISPHANNAEYSFDPANIPANVSGKIKGRIPDLPIVTLASDEATLALGAGGETQWRPVVAKEDRERWNDWGIGLLLQGDLKGAEYAFKMVTAIDPQYADGWVNVARALIQEGQTDAAAPFVEHALALDGRLGRAHYFRALVQKAAGDYDGALRSLRLAASWYPRDRVVWNQIGRVLYLDRRYAEAVAALDEVRRVDTEDVQMHYTLMLCYRALGDDRAAEREQLLFKRFKADESAQSITATRRLISPEDNNERQAVHDHVSAPLERSGSIAATRIAAPGRTRAIGAPGGGR
jgi:tetratricopeptide (TPR) repeat protein